MRFAEIRMLLTECLRHAPGRTWLLLILTPLGAITPGLTADGLQWVVDGVLTGSRPMLIGGAICAVTAGSRRRWRRPRGGDRMPVEQAADGAERARGSGERRQLGGQGVGVRVEVQGRVREKVQALRSFARATRWLTTHGPGA